VIGGCSFEVKNQHCFYINFTRLHLSFQLYVASVNLPNPPLCAIVVFIWKSKLWMKILVVGRWLGSLSYTTF